MPSFGFQLQKQRNSENSGTDYNRSHQSLQLPQLFIIFKNAIISEIAVSKQSAYGFDYMEHSGRRFHSENNLNATAENRNKREETHPELLRCGL